jgi:hypothetical protein
MKLRRLVYSLVVLTSLWTGQGGDAHAQADPEKLRLAAEEFDAGRRAYKLGDFAKAATHFENAYRDAPSSQALRMAIRSRSEAEHHARAATLCVLALSLYAEDAETVGLARRVLEQRSPQLHKVTVECEPACTVLLDGRLVRDDAATRQVIFVSEGKHTLVAGWSGKRSVSRDLEATPGGSTVLGFEAPPLPAEVPSVAPSAPVAEPVEVGGDSGKASPTLFWLGAGVTAVFGGITVWSGIDTLNNPGPDAVRAACVGRGTSCPQYQEGLDKQARTNYLLLGTGVGVASVAVIGLFFTDWGQDQGRESSTALSFSPVADPVGGSVGMAASKRF